MLTDPVKEEEADRHRIIFLCYIASGFIGPSELGVYAVGAVCEEDMSAPMQPDAGRMKTFSPKGKRYAY